MRIRVLLALVLLLFATSCTSLFEEGSAAWTHVQQPPLPVVLMHGINTDASVMDPVVQWIQEAIPGVYVKNVEIGDGRHDSIHLNMNVQLEIFANVVRSDANLTNGFHLIGYSQGGLITRGYVERYNDPPVFNYITWSSPHGGEFGVPDFHVPYLKYVMDGRAYEAWLQDTFSFADYWKDPFDLEMYLTYSSYLADINNERDEKNATYYDNFTSLNRLVLLYSEVDEVIIPRESGWFYFYPPNTTDMVLPVWDTAFYSEDWIGLRELNDTGRLSLFATKCKHKDYPTDKCKSYFTEFTLPLLLEQPTDEWKQRLLRKRERIRRRSDNGNNNNNNNDNDNDNDNEEEEDDDGKDDINGNGSGGSGGSRSSKQ